jgi:AraC-like DNA-binding protein
MHIALIVCDAATAGLNPSRHINTLRLQYPDSVVVQYLPLNHSITNTELLRFASADTCGLIIAGVDDLPATGHGSVTALQAAEVWRRLRRHPSFGSMHESRLLFKTILLSAGYRAHAYDIAEREDLSTRGLLKRARASTGLGTRQLSNWAVVLLAAFILERRSRGVRQVAADLGLRQQRSLRRIVFHLLGVLPRDLNRYGSFEEALNCFFNALSIK